jgi:hypothetical protein
MFPVSVMQVHMAALDRWHGNNDEGSASAWLQSRLVPPKSISRYVNLLR